MGIFHKGEEGSNTKSGAFRTPSGVVEEKKTPPPPPRPPEQESELEAQLRERFGKATSALALGTVISGKLSFDTSVRIDGHLTGELISSKTVIVGSEGVVDAKMDVDVLIVLGRVRGEVKASRVEIISGGQVEGDVTTPVLVVEQNCILNGTCRMPAVVEGKGASTDEASTAYKQQILTASQGESALNIS